MDIKNLSIRKASEAMKKGDLTPKDLALSYKKVAEEKIVPSTRFLRFSLT
jgi:hypothetical protein